MVIAAGIWARAVFSVVAVTSGASLAVGPVVTDILLAGAVLDAAVVSVVYALCRWVGWPVRSLDLEQEGF